MAGQAGEGNAAGGGAAGGGAGAGSAGGGEGGGSTVTPKYAAWADYLATQDDEVKGLYEKDVQGLKTALASEREEKKGLERQVRDLAGKAEAGSEAQKNLTELADKIAEGDRRTNFYEDAHKEGVSNLKLAYTIAVQDDLFDRKGVADLDKLKKNYPELFSAKRETPPAGKGGAGAGAGGGKQPGGGGGGGDMNSLIRGASGRRT